MKGKRMIWALLVLVVLGLTGCMQKSYTGASSGASEPAPPSPPAPTYRFEDLPVPSTMSLLRPESYVFESGSMRAAIMVYEGKDDPAELVKFYRDNMPQHNWKLISVFEHEEASMNFQKPGWSCSISVVKRAMQTTRLTIMIGPQETKEPKA